MPMQNNLARAPHSSYPPARAGEWTARATDGSAADPTSLQILLQQAHRVCYAPQEALYHAGGANDTILFVTQGLLKLVSYLHSGRARIVRLHNAGAVLGLGALRGRKREHTAIAVTPVTTLRLPVAALQRLRTEDPETYMSLLERWHDYLHDADTWITEFSTGPIRGRVARLLAFLMKFETHMGGDQVQLLTCEEMGAILGVTSESTSRILAEFKRQGILVGHCGESHELYQADENRLRAIGQKE
jgi:CRP/FNR family transcriptional regulator